MVMAGDGEGSERARGGNSGEKETGEAERGSAGRRESFKVSGFHFGSTECEGLASSNTLYKLYSPINYHRPPR